MKRGHGVAVRWFDAEQALSWALQAYYAACREMVPPEGYDGAPEAWASGGDFVQAFHSALTLRLCAAAYVRGDVVHSGSASEVLGWPSDADHAGKAAFIDRLKMAGLPVVDNHADNVVAGSMQNATTAR